MKQANFPDIKPSSLLIGFWGCPNPEIVSQLNAEYPQAEWFDLDLDFGIADTNILPDAYCKIIKNIINNAVFLKSKIIKIVAATGKDKCDSGWFAAQVLKDLGLDVIESRFEDLTKKRDAKICTSDLPLIEKVQLIMDEVVDAPLIKTSGIKKPLSFKPSKPLFGFWGVPPNDLEILELFPAQTHVFGWTRCVEANTPADIELEMFVDENLPTVFYSQAFCAKSQLAKYLADKYNGLYIDIDDYATNSIKAKIEAFIKLR